MHNVCKCIKKKICTTSLWLCYLKKKLMLNVLKMTDAAGLLKKCTCEIDTLSQIFLMKII